MRDLVLGGASEDRMAEYAFRTRGLRTLLNDGACKIVAGATTPEEVRRVTFLGEGF